MDATYFPYGETEITYLKNKDKRLAAVIEQVGHIDRTGDTDLFSSVVHHILGQQISTKAQQTIWTKLMTELGAVTPNTLLACGRERLQAPDDRGRDSAAAGGKGDAAHPHSGRRWTAPPAVHP